MSCSSEHNARSCSIRDGSFFSLFFPSSSLSCNCYGRIKQNPFFFWSFLHIPSHLCGEQQKMTCTIHTTHEFNALFVDQSSALLLPYSCQHSMILPSWGNGEGYLILISVPGNYSMWGTDLLCEYHLETDFAQITLMNIYWAPAS